MIIKKNYIILPMYNDWASLRKVLDILNRSFKNTKDYNHIIIVNDCSDNKFQRKKYINFKSITILNLRKNVGSQKAIFFGLKYLQKVLRENIDLNKKRVIIILPINPWQKVINFPDNSEQVEYILVKLNKSDFFIIDDHPNMFGHREIARKIYDYLSTD